MAGKAFGGKQGANWKHSGMTTKRFDALKKAHDAAASLRKGSGKGTTFGTSGRSRAVLKKEHDAVIKAHKAKTLGGMTGKQVTALRTSYKAKAKAFTSVNTRAQMPKLKISPAMKSLSSKYKALSREKLSAKKSGANSATVRNITKKMNRVVKNMNKLK